MPPRTSATAAGGGKALVGLLGLAVGLVVGYGAGRVSTGTPINPLAPPAARPEAANQAQPEAGFQPPVLTESTSVQGTVKAVSEGKLTIEADNSLFDPTDKRGLPKTRVVTITAETELVMMVERSPAEMEAAQAAFAEESSAFEPGGENPAPPPLPPNPYKEVKITLDQIKAGAEVLVLASTDIISASTFEAARVTVLPESRAPEPANEPPPPLPPPTPTP